MVDYKKVVLVNPPVWNARSPPLNIAYLSAYAKLHGYNVKCFDFNIEFLNKVPSEYKKFWKGEFMEFWNDDLLWKTQLKPKIGKYLIKQMVSKIIGQKPGVVGFSINYSSPLLIEVSELIKKEDPNIIIVVGGNLSEIFLSGEQLLKSGNIDFSVMGEGELTFIEILKRLDNGKILDDIEGTSVFREGKILENKRRPRFSQIDNIPFPDFSDFDLGLYLERDLLTSAVWLPILFSRGCIYECDFCLQKWIWGKSFTTRSAENVVEEIELFIQEYGINKFQFSDLEINGNLRILESFCDLIIEKKIDISWGGTAIIRKDMELRLLKKMRQAGCDWLDFGLESGSKSVILSMGKNFSPGEAVEQFREVHEANIVVTLSLIVGYPWESEIDFNETISLLKRSFKYMSIPPSVSSCTVFPRTPLHKKLIQSGVPEEDALWVKWKNGNNDFNERKRRIKLLDQFVKENFDKKGISIPDDEIYHFKNAK